MSVNIIGTFDSLDKRNIQNILDLFNDEGFLSIIRNAILETSLSDNSSYLIKLFKRLGKGEKLSPIETKELNSLFININFINTLKEQFSLSQNQIDSFKNTIILSILSDNGINYFRNQLFSAISELSREDHIPKLAKTDFALSWSDLNINTTGWKIVETNGLRIRKNNEFTINNVKFPCGSIIEIMDGKFKGKQLFKNEAISKLIISGLFNNGSINRRSISGDRVLEDSHIYYAGTGGNQKFIDDYNISLCGYWHDDKGLVDYGKVARFWCGTGGTAMSVSIATTYKLYEQDFDFDYEEAFLIRFDS